MKTVTLDPGLLLVLPPIAPRVKTATNSLDSLIDMAKDNPNHDELGRFASGPGGGWSGDVEWRSLARDATPFERQQAVTKMIREEAGRWDAKTQAALRSVTVDYMSPQDTRRGVMGFTKPAGTDQAEVTIHPDIAGDRYAQYEQARNVELERIGKHPREVTPLDGMFLASKGDQTSGRWVINHEIAHVFLVAHAGVSGPAQAKFLQDHGMNEQALNEMNRVTSYGARSNFNEKFSEAAALYMTSGRVPGENTAALLRATGIIKP